MEESNEMTAIAMKLAETQVRENKTCLCGKTRRFNFNIVTGSFKEPGALSLVGFALCDDCLKRPVKDILTAISIQMVATSSEIH